MLQNLLETPFRADVLSARPVAVRNCRGGMQEVLQQSLRASGFFRFRVLLGGGFLILLRDGGGSDGGG